MEMNDVWMVQPPMVVDLARQLRGSRLGDLLDRAPSPRDAMGRNVDAAECT